MLLFLILFVFTSVSSCNITLNVEHLTQPTSKTGGPTSLAMIMNYFGKSYTGQNVCEYIGSCNRNTGTGFDELLNAAKHYGFSNAIWKYGIDEFKKTLLNNNPIVAIIDVKVNNYPKLINGTSAYITYNGGAYIEIHGIHCDLNGNIDYFIVNDPSQNGWKNRKYTYESMKNAWGNRDYRFLTLNENSSSNDNINDNTNDNTNVCTKKLTIPPFQKQPTSYSCGPTSLAMAMNYYGYSYTGKQICTWIGNCYRTSGTDFNEMLSAAKHYGFSNASWKYGINELKKALSKKITTVAIINAKANSYPKMTNGEPAFYSYTGGHYIEIHGIHCDSTGEIDYYYCNDPAQSTGKDRKYTASSMKSAWGNRSYRFLALK